ncbi:PIG-L family deacetylase [Algisphaera agarilytica]|uniref:Bacillithiol biosynthesis deacetylase BshB1 n=1 Tax=Algisphaera agarilytica TaxID=1385975 RepID=A0A7X0H3X2_9BACT|nr:PIG-L family deacetylase [Algisphaera agarilytica]MBB6428602.1 bacillithiol biosynthesis deacetylase BshB1 [Algisphaera agarilytica]
MNIIVTGPHPDDQELGMGGTIARLASQGHNVLVLDMTNGEPTPYGSVEQREIEWNAALEVLNRQAANGGKVTRRLLGLKNREVQHTLEARHAMAGVIREHQAEMIFLPFEEDAHPDHRAVTRIVEDARFDAKLTKTDLPGEPIYPKWMIYYYCTHLRWVANPSFCLDITEQMDLKVDSIKAYETQFVIPEKNRRVVEFVREMNGYIGSRIGTRYAEPFFTKEPLGLNSLEGLVM